MGLSYKRPWLLIETMNVCFTRPVVEAAKGGKAGGGARLTPFGDEALTRYRACKRRPIGSSAAISPG
jgi:molybdate transport system regulatory protein